MSAKIVEYSSPTKYGLEEFENLKTSTRTFMVYANMEFNLSEIFKHAEITEIEVPLTKRKKNIDKKKLKAPKGTIISMQWTDYIRGIDTRKSRKHWCENCRLITQNGDKEVKILTVVEEVKPEDDPTITYHSDLKKIHYFCTSCSRYYTAKELGKISHFLNQVTIVISIGDVLLNIMNFRNSLKIAGCKRDEDAYECTKILWENFYQKEAKIWTMIQEGDEHSKFVLRRVMRNVGFNLGFPIDLNKLNTLMNEERYNKYVDVSQRETTGHPNVNISMFSRRPVDFAYDVIVYSGNKIVHHMETMKENPYEKKKETKAHTTFIVFSSSQIILSGRYMAEMKTLYNFFINEVMSNKQNLEENLRKPGNDILSFLSSMEGGMKTIK